MHQYETKANTIQQLIADIVNPLLLFSQSFGELLANETF
ncbi:hypothetical protein VCHA52P453_80057 [Vibrio chagasii]|nr:hypothetical protein VCHA52P453_80057 [Vibrio chagasii]CAH7423610.1 hypothetical protein VCHA52P456_80156 [Vibrio chagasii]